MTQVQMQYFEQTCRAGSIAAAADALFVSRSVVSRTISELEKEFQAQLFVRASNGVRLTRAGELLRQMVSAMDGTYRITRERIAKLQEEPESSKLTIGITPTIGLQVYRLVLSEYMSRYPHTAVTIVESSAARAYQLVLDGVVDASFTPTMPDTSPMIQSMNLYHSRITLGVARTTPLARKRVATIEDILALPLGFLEAPLPSHIEHTLRKCCAAFQCELKVVIRTSIHELLKRLTQEGRIGAVLPDDMMAGWKGVVAIPMDFIPATTNRLVWNRAVPHSAAFYDFLEFTRSHMQAKDQGTQ